MYVTYNLQCETESLISCPWGIEIRMIYFGIQHLPTIPTIQLNPQSDNYLQSVWFTSIYKTSLNFQMSQVNIAEQYKHFVTDVSDLFHLVHVFFY
jgi:hypothetical protein